MISIQDNTPLGEFFPPPATRTKNYLSKLANAAFIKEYSQFFTAGINGRYKLLQHDSYSYRDKDIINSLRFLVEDKRIKLYAFAIMQDHIHLIWQMQPLIHPQHVQRDFLKYTAQQIKLDLQRNNPEALTHFETDANDRAYQFWKRRSLSIELRTDKVYQQKLDYIPARPVRRALESGKGWNL
ncbi:MAG TPA: transposase [Chitinophagaceae bacterium]|nr:transposase [Chitinophagaceae bacterium]